MEIIVPAAGLSTRFPNMKPKYLLYDYKGEMMLMNALRPFRQKGYRMHIGILKEHEEKYNVIKQIQYEWGDNIKYVILDKPTKGPADTVYQIIESSELHTSEIFIKDCDSFFEHDITTGDNYVCVSRIQDHGILRKLSSKSFTISNENDIITDIIEKKVVSDTFCVGGYGFESVKSYCDSFEKITEESREIYVSDVIAHQLNYREIFTSVNVRNYTDVGTAQDWFEFNDKPVIFCDIDGTIIKAQGRYGENNYNDEPIILEENVKRLQELYKDGAQIIFTTARCVTHETQTRKVLSKLGFSACKLIMGLNNSHRILINDYNNSNPFPRAQAINIKRDTDNLKDFL